MGIEMERKFLVKKDIFLDKTNIKDIWEIEQHYISNIGDARVRRIVKKNYSNDSEHKLFFFTYKVGENSLQRIEIEKQITEEEYLEIVNSSSVLFLEKKRYIYEYNGDRWEIDFFKDLNIILAEIEIPHTDYQVSIPKWVAKEVTGDINYNNFNIAKSIVR